MLTSCPTQNSQPSLPAPEGSGMSHIAQVWPRAWNILAWATDGTGKGCNERSNPLSWVGLPEAGEVTGAFWVEQCAPSLIQPFRISLTLHAQGELGVDLCPRKGCT